MSTNAIAKIDFSKEQMAVIQTQFFPAGATKPEMEYCFAVSRELGLNPITKEVHFVPRRQKVGDKWVNRIEPMVGRDGFLAIAHRSGQLAGMETTACIREVPQLVGGTWKQRQDLIAECKVYRKDSTIPFTVTVSFSEYVQRNNENQPTSFWGSKPETMLKKVAESQALRKAFNIHGVYSPEEMGAGFETDSGDLVMAPVIEVEAVPVAGKKSVSSPPPSPPPPDDDEQSWPPPGPEPRHSDPHNGNPNLEEITAMLAAKGIKYEVDEECGYITAKSFAQKDFLKAIGFRWEPDIKSWVWSEMKEAA